MFKFWCYIRSRCYATDLSSYWKEAGGFSISTLNSLLLAIVLQPFPDDTAATVLSTRSDNVSSRLRLSLICVRRLCMSFRQSQLDSRSFKRLNSWVCSSIFCSSFVIWCDRAANIVVTSRKRHVTSRNQFKSRSNTKRWQLIKAVQISAADYKINPCSKVWCWAGLQI